MINDLPTEIQEEIYILSALQFYEEDEKSNQQFDDHDHDETETLDEKIALSNRQKNPTLSLATKSFLLISLSKTIAFKVLLRKFNMTEQTIIQKKLRLLKLLPSKTMTYLHSIVNSPLYHPKFGLKFLNFYSKETNAIDILWINILFESASTLGNTKLLQNLFLSPRNSLITQQTLDSSLIQSCICNTEQISSILLQKGADITTDNQSPICMSSKYGHTSLTRLLLHSNADPNASNGYPLTWASRNGHLDACKLLIEEFSAQININNGAPLNNAAEFGNIEIVQYLIDKGADIHLSDDYPLRWACIRGHVDVVRLLCERGALIVALENFALRTSVQLKLYEVVEVLIQFGGDVLCGDSVLIRGAVGCADQRMVDLLLKGGKRNFVKEE